MIAVAGATGYIGGLLCAKLREEGQEVRALARNPDRAGELKELGCEVVEADVLEADGLESEIFELAGEEFTLGSPKQLEEILFGKLGLSRGRRGKTGYSTDARVLQAIRAEHDIIPKIERWRELTKLAQTYLDALPLLVDDRSRLHTTFNQTAATTGRRHSTALAKVSPTQVQT